MVQVGAAVTSFKVGDKAAVGCMVSSCGSCDRCKEGLEQHCGAMVQTYGSKVDDDSQYDYTLGGYSEAIVVEEAFVLRVPDNLDLARTAPLLCAGITTYSPLRQYGAGPGKKVGVVGLGGLGHVAVKLAAAMGAQTIGFTRSPSKVDSIKALGAHEVIVSTDAEQLKKHANSFDLIIDTVSGTHDVNALAGLLSFRGTLCMVGASPDSHAVNAFPLIFGRRSIAGSLIGGIAETQEMLDFCAQHNITAEIELIPIQKINEAYERLLKSDVKYRFVIDMKTLNDEQLA